MKKIVGNQQLLPVHNSVTLVCFFSLLPWPNYPTAIIIIYYKYMYNDIKEWSSIKEAHQLHSTGFNTRLAVVSMPQAPSLYPTGYMHITHAWQRYADVIMATHTARHCLRRLSLLWFTLASAKIGMLGVFPHEHAGVFHIVQSLCVPLRSDKAFRSVL